MIDSVLFRNADKELIYLSIKDSNGYGNPLVYMQETPYEQNDLKAWEKMHDKVMDEMDRLELLRQAIDEVLYPACEKD